MNSDKGYNLKEGGANGKLSEVHKKKISKAKSKAIYCVELDCVFDSQKQAAEELNISPGNLSACLNGKRYYKTCGGYHWKYVR